jgi:hypothetical protein
MKTIPLAPSETADKFVTSHAIKEGKRENDGMMREEKVKNNTIDREIRKRRRRGRRGKQSGGNLKYDLCRRKRNISERKGRR